jgi:hypothetical protein
MVLEQDRNHASERFSVIEARSKTEDELLQLLLYTKDRSWKYEREWRVLLKLADLALEGSFHFYNLDGPIRLAEVILGADCDLSPVTVRNLVSNLHPGAGTVRGRLGLGFFKIVPDEKTIIA